MGENEINVRNSLPSLYIPSHSSKDNWIMEK